MSQREEVTASGLVAYPISGLPSSINGPNERAAFDRLNLDTPKIDELRYQQAQGANVGWTTASRKTIGTVTPVLLECDGRQGPPPTLAVGDGLGNYGSAGVTAVSPMWSVDLNRILADGLKEGCPINATVDVRYNATIASQASALVLIIEGDLGGGFVELNRIRKSIQRDNVNDYDISFGVQRVPFAGIIAVQFRLLAIDGDIDVYKPIVTIEQTLCGITNLIPAP